MAVAPKITLRKIDALAVDPRNARTHSPEQIAMLAATINRLGWTNPVIADDVIRAGHGRVMAATTIYAGGGLIYMAPGKERGGKALPAGTVPVIDCTGWTEDERKAYALADNQLALQAGWDMEILAEQIAELQGVDFQIAEIGFDSSALDALSMIPQIPAGPAEQTKPSGSLADEFMIPPFSVLNAREGWWQDRKRAWLAIGIQSEVGRGSNVLDMSAQMAGLTDPAEIAAWNAKRRSDASPGGSPRPAMDYSNKDRGDGAGKGLKKGKSKDTPPGESTQIPGALTIGVSMQAYGQQVKAKNRTLARTSGQDLMRGEGKGLSYGVNECVRDKTEEGDIAGGLSGNQSGTSIFDPVLCELAYRWFSPVGGRVLDPFAGGSVRGIVAGVLGRSYVGIDLRPEQINANNAQWPGIADQLPDAVEPVWHAGDSRDVLSARHAPDDDLIGDGFDFLFSCPPYGDLEIYSDDPADISNMTIGEFDNAYRSIIERAVARLAPDRFACFVIGDYRNKRGIYANFVSKTIAAFEAAGAQLYNEAILVTAVGSLPIRAAKQFRTTRKLGKTHQNVLVFVKGDPRKATEACGTVDVSDALFADMEKADVPDAGLSDELEQLD